MLAPKHFRVKKKYGFMIFFAGAVVHCNQDKQHYACDVCRQYYIVVYAHLVGKCEHSIYHEECAGRYF